MGSITILLIATGLAMDAFAVSISCGITSAKNLKREALTLGLMFGFFQSLMTLVGWFAGSLFFSVIEPFSHWLSFVLLLFIGIKMIKEAFHPPSCENKDMSFILLITMSIATSIDALAVGISFSTLSIPIIKPTIIIGLVAFIFSFIGVFLGKTAKNTLKLEKEFEIIGGIILILIGLKILLSHFGAL